MARYSGYTLDKETLSQFGGQPSNNQSYTEQDLIRMLIDSSEGKTTSAEASIKLCMRIWSGYTKFIRSQCNKDRIIDSQYFGSFFKKDSSNDNLETQDSDRKIPVGGGNTYACVNDSKKFNTFSEFKCNVNSENFQLVPAIYTSRDKVEVNLKAIAQVCNCN